MKIRKDKGIPRKDLTGQKFGNLTVLSFLEIRLQGRGQVSFYQCKCDCGVTKAIKGTHLTRGDTKTCGASIHKTLPNNASKVWAKWLSYEKHAKERNLSWNLSYAMFDSLIRMKCHYCRVKMKMFNGIDRVDNKDGYEAYNCVPCCETCNSMKSNYTLDQFLNKIGDIYESA